MERNCEALKINIGRKTGQITPSIETNPYYEGLTIIGQIDRLHTGSTSPWKPPISEITHYLEGIPTRELASKVSSIEGQYLAIWRKGLTTFIFCDRYCQYPFYYRLTGESLELFDRILDQGYELAISQENALAFIFLRYIPGRKTLFEGIFRIMPGDCLILDHTTGQIKIEVGIVYPKLDVDVENEDAAAETFHQMFREALEKRLSSFSESEKFLIPLSGGLDSRYVLGTALELFPPSRIVAMTFGQVGSYDFDIGRLVAKTVGVRHIAYPLTPENYTDEALVNNCRDTDGQISFTTEAPVEIFRDFAQYGMVTLSGYVGDAIMGNKAHYGSPNDRRRIVLNDALVRSKDPVVEYFPQSIMDASFYYQQKVPFSLEPSEMWFFINHFTKYSYYCVYKLRDTFKYISPFIDYAFLDYVLNLPMEMRVGRHLHIKWLRQYFPLLADIPCSLYRGAALSASPLMRFFTHQWDRIIRYGLGKDNKINKIDFFRYRERINKAVQSRIQMTGFLPPDFTHKLFRTRRYYWLIYNLSCLLTLQKDFGGRFLA